MGRAAGLLGVTPLRSAGGHRRYSRYRLRIVARAPGNSLTMGPPIAAPCRIAATQTPGYDTANQITITGYG